MLRIREQQQDSMLEQQWNELVPELLDHLRAELPEHWLDLPLDEAAEEVRRGVHEARNHEFSLYGELVRFLEVRTLVGPRFGTIPEHGTALNALRAPAIVSGWPATRITIIEMSGGEDSWD